MPDESYLNYSQAALSNNNPMAGFDVAGYCSQSPRGAFALNGQNSPTPFTPSCVRYTNASAAPDANQTIVATGAGGERWVVIQQGKFTEPLFLSPFIFGDAQYNQSGLAGINQLSLNCTIDTSAKRFFFSINNFLF